VRRTGAERRVGRRPAASDRARARGRGEKEGGRGVRGWAPCGGWDVSDAGASG
jgi:hypothetical protein